MTKESPRELSTTESGQLEWVVTDGTGTFALGCLDHVARRKYHSLLSVADGLIPGGGKNLILDLGEELRIGESRVALSGIHSSFRASPNPRWTWEIPVAGSDAKIRVERQIRPLKHCCREQLDAGMKILYLLSVEPKRGQLPETSLVCEPKLLSRPIHALMRKNPALDGRPRSHGERTWEFQLYQEDPRIILSWGGAIPAFVADGRWERVDHVWEAERGYESSEECFIPGQFILRWDGKTELRSALHAGYKDPRALGMITVPSRQKPHHQCECEMEVVAPAEQSRSRLTRLSHRLKSAAQSFAADIAADTDGGEGASPTLLAGLPWFGPWARDLFVCQPGYALAVRGSELPYLMMVTGGRRLIRDLAEGKSQGMNTHGADTPWLYLWALEHLIAQGALSRVQERVLLELGADIAGAVVRGAQPGVHAQAQGGIRIDAGPWAKTWMDATIDGVPVTPRSGFPIELNALYVNGLGFLVEHSAALGKHPALPQIREAHSASIAGFMNLFRSPSSDVLGDGFTERAGAGVSDLDLTIRPNCLWALALPRVIVPRSTALNTLRMVRAHLLTPAGLRTLSPSDRAYRGNCLGDQRQRDLSYHQGTVWPWLLGVYADSVLRWEDAKTLGTDLKPVWEWLERHLDSEGCIGEVSEIFDGDAPHEARGAPAQAWSACELLRVLSVLDGKARVK